MFLDEPDNYLTCVGFWMEDMKSYLITWDEEDAVSSFRCWVRMPVQFFGSGIGVRGTWSECCGLWMENMK